MRLGIKGKQVLGVTTIVGVVVVAMSVMHLARLARVSLDESLARADLLMKGISHRAREVVQEGVDPDEALRSDPGLRSILQSSLYSNDVAFAAIVDVNGIAVAHGDPALEGQPVRTGDELSSLLSRSPLSLLWALYSGEGRNLELRQPLLIGGNTEFGSIRIGVSTVLFRSDLYKSLVQPAITTALIALLIAVSGAMVLAQLLLRPMHVIRSGLSRLGRGEFGIRLELDQQDEFGELGTFFNTVSAQLSADRSQMASLESAVGHLEDALSIVGPTGELLFANPAMRTLLPGAAAGATFNDLVPPEHPLRRLAEQTLASRQARGPISATFSPSQGEHLERLIMSHPVADAAGELVGIMLICRNVEYLSRMQSTLRYSRKLAALGRLSAGVAHEVKNPLNAMMIHLELLRQQFETRSVAVAAGGSRRVAFEAVAAPQGVNSVRALEHVDVIAGEIRRLDEVVQGFLKFTRPEDLKLQPVQLSALLDEVVPILRPEAERNHVALEVDVQAAPDVNADPAMLRQAFLNLGLNACQAMPQGGTLSIRGEAARGRRTAIIFEDTGVGIEPEHLGRIFDLYFTTKDKGSGIGLSMVFRTVQMHDGEIEVQSTPGKGTTFRVLLPQA
jgi:signal transduction histidine kinase